MSHCNSVIRAFLTTQFFIILPNCDGFPRFFYFVQQKILFHTTHLLFVTSLKIKACNITQVKRVLFDCETAVTICGTTRSSSKTLKQKQHGASKDYQEPLELSNDNNAYTGEK